MADQPGAVDGKADGQVLQGHVMHDLVLAALQETGINRAERPHPRCRQTRRKGRAMLLGNPHIKSPARKAFRLVSSPVPPGIAAVIATILGSRAATSARCCAKTAV